MIKFRKDEFGQLNYNEEIGSKCFKSYVIFLKIGVKLKFVYCVLELLRSLLKVVCFVYNNMFYV